MQLVEFDFYKSMYPQFTDKDRLIIYSWESGKQVGY